MDMSTPTPRIRRVCDGCGDTFYPAQLIQFRGRTLCSESEQGARDGCFCKEHLPELTEYEVTLVRSACGDSLPPSTFNFSWLAPFNVALDRAISKHGLAMTQGDWLHGRPRNS